MIKSIKMKSKIIKDTSNTSKIINNYINKDNNDCLENEIALIIKKIRKEINTYNKIYKNHKLDLMQTMNEYEIENNKFKKINNKISILENKVEVNYKMINKIKKKKIYAISSILKFKKLYKKENLEQYKSLLNVGLNGPKDNYDYLDIIKENDKEFNYYLIFLEKYYKSLKKENVIEFNQKKNNINISINDENLSFPEDKLLFYLSYVVQIIDLEEELNKKSEELKNEEIRKIDLNTKIKKLGILKNEQKNFITDAKDYIELLKNMIQKYYSYQKKFKNNLISKDTFYKKIKKLQSINLQNFQIENNTPKNNNNIMNETIKSFFSQKTRHLIFISKRKNKFFSNNLLESKSQNISRNISTDYLPKVEPLEKKYIFEKNDTSLNDIFFKMSKEEDDISENVNISENSDYESPVSTINITSRKMSFTTNQISNKTTIQNNKIKEEIPNSDFSINNSNLAIIDNNQKLIRKVPNNIYCKKKLNFNSNISNENKENKTSKTKINISDKTKTIMKRNKILIDNKNLKLPKKESETANCKKSLYFLKKINRNKPFFINKDKLFNKNLAKTLALEKTKLNTFHKEENSSRKTQNASNNNKLNNYIESFEIFDLQNGKEENLINHECTREINSYHKYININQKKSVNNIPLIKDGTNQKKYLYFKKNKIRMQRTLDVKSDIPTENCCFSCL